MVCQEKIRNILNRMDEHYPMDGKCYLSYSKPYELMIATILSAQCTDDRVNMVTAGLFVKYPSLEAFAFADINEMEKDVKSTGFYRNKAKNIILSCHKLLTEYGGDMPEDIGKLILFPGVGRKTANVIRSNVFHIPSIVVDTHVKRVSSRLGLTDNTDPEKIEYDLMEILPESHWIRYNPQIIAHGRKTCKAPNPKCGECFLTDVCTFFGSNG